MSPYQASSSTSTLQQDCQAPSFIQRLTWCCPSFRELFLAVAGCLSLPSVWCVCYSRSKDVLQFEKQIAADHKELPCTRRQSEQENQATDEQKTYHRFNSYAKVVEGRGKVTAKGDVTRIAVAVTCALKVYCCVVHTTQGGQVTRRQAHFWASF